jgi:hypothetical protein
MKLSELVDLLNLLDSDAMIPDFESATRQLRAIQHTISNHNVQVKKVSSQYSTDLDAIKHAYDHAQITLGNLRSSLLKLIQQTQQSQYDQSQHLYEYEMRNETTEYILNRKLHVNFNNRMTLVGRLLQYTDWRVPGMILRPGHEPFIEHLVSLDPLYIVDQNLQLLQPAIDRFTQEYQRRLRPYEINDYCDLNPLSQLPSNQFGLVFAYNYFNYKPLEVVCRYLNDIFDKLRPGGAAIFTYNDCDWAHGVALAEKNFMCYTPGGEIQAYCNQLGFETISINRCPGDLSWMEIKKPGKIESIRGGQNLAKIIAN